MNNEEKILAMLTQMQTDITGMKGDITGMKGDIAGTKGDITGMKGDIAGMKGDIAGTKGDITGMKDDIAGMKGDIAGTKGDITGMKDDITSIKVRLDYDVDRRLKALSEGQSAIEKRLDAVEGSLAEVKELSESTADKVDVIHAVVARHSAAITELKNAQ